MIFKPHKYQDRAIKTILKLNKSMLCLDMGLGKTVITLSAIKQMQDVFEIGECLVIAPLSVARNTWINEAQKWDHLSDMRISLVLGSKEQREKALNSNADIFVINRENTQWLCEQLPDLSKKFSMIVIDESSSFKSPQAKRFKYLKKASKYVERLLLLTGTPSPNGYEDLWAQYYLLDQGKRLFPTITAFRNQWFRPAYGSGNIVYKWAIKKGAADEITSRIADITLSMKAADYLELPSLIINKYDIAFSDSIAKEYKQFAKDLVLKLTEKIITAETAVALSNKLHQFTSGALYDDCRMIYQIHNEKIEALCELVEMAQSQGANVLIFYSYQHELPRMADALKEYSPKSFSGEPEILNQWNENKIKVLMAHPASVSYGLNMQQGGHIIIWFSLTWSLEQYLQANARLYRQGQTKPVTVYQMCVKNTIDEVIATSLTNKNSLQEALLQAIKEI